MSNVYSKLQAARIALQSKKLNKSGHNKFAGYSYFELADFLPTVQQIFSELGLCGTVSFTKDYADLRIVNVDKPEEFIAFSSPMFEANLKGCHPIQNLGAMETYSRRYLWVTAMEIVEHDALDSSKPLTEHEANERNNEPEEFERVFNVLKQSEITADTLKSLPNHFGGNKDKATRFWKAYSKQLKGQA